MTSQTKITDYGRAPEVYSGDLLLVVRTPNTVPTTNTATVDAVFGNVNVPVGLNANVVANTGVVITAPEVHVANLVMTTLHTPTSSGEVSPQGRITFDANYVYFTVANNLIKRIPLQSF